MSDIAKKYVKALTQSLDDNTLEALERDLQAIVPAFRDKKFQAIVQSSEIPKAKKVEFLSGMLSLKDQKVENFVRLLVEKGRIGLIPAIVKELGRVIEERRKTYSGRVISAQKVDDQALKEIEDTLSGKLGVTVRLENVVSDYPGMKVEIENLGLEIGLSMDRIKQQIAQTILSAI